MPENSKAEPMLQSSLGRVANNSTKKDRSWNNGYLAFGKILKIHYKRNTADVKLLKMSDTLMSEVEQEGKHACRIAVQSAGVDKEFKEPYGEIIPLQKGMIVLVAFLKNTKEKPVIIRAFHDISEDDGAINYENILPSQEIPETNIAEMFRYTNISRVQDVYTVDGVGNHEFSLHSKSLFVAKDGSFDEETFDYEDLSTKNKKTNKTVYIPERKSFPLKFLACFRDNYTDGETNWLRMIVDAAKTSFRLAKQQQKLDMLTSIEIAEDGTFKLRRQCDTMTFDSGSDYVEIKISPEADVTVTKEKAGKVTTIKVNEEGVNLTTDEKVSCNAKKGVKVETEKGIDFSAKENIDFKVGGSTMKMLPSGIALNSTKIDLN